MTASRFVYGEEERLIPWAEERVKPHRFREDARAIGHEIAGKLVAVVVYDTFSPKGCMVSLAADTSGRWAAWRWSSRDFALVAMAYPFIQCGFSRISCIISSTNTRSLRYTRHFGWTQEGILREAGPDGEDMILFGMLRRECRYLPPILPVAGVPARGTV